jgi:Na+-driven multidrug efflux pump
LSAAPPPRAGILRLSAPLVASFWLRSAFAWIDPVFAHHLEDASGNPIGDQSLAAIGLTLPLEFLMIAVWVGSSNGLTSRLAAAMGGGRHAEVEQLKRAASRVIVALCGGFLLLAAATWLLADHYVDDPVVATQFRVYAAVLLGGSAFTSFWSILPDSLIKAHHDTRATMWAGILSSVTNLVLNAVFVFGFGWGIFGIALSTVLGRIAGLTYALRVAARHERARRASAGEEVAPRLLPRPVASILSIAVPSGTAYVLMALESQVVNLLLKRLPDATSALAAWSIFDRSVRFLAMPLIASGVALLPLVARAWGGGQRRAARREIRVAAFAGGCYAVLFVGPAAFLLGPWVADQLSEAERTRELARLAMPILPWAVFAAVPALQLRSVFDAIGRQNLGLVVSLVRSAVCVVPLVLAGIRFAPDLGLSEVEGASWGFGAGLALASAVLTLALRRELGREEA